MTGHGLRGRRLAGLLLLAAIAIDLFAALLFVSQPSYIGPMTSESPPLGWWLVPAVGIAWNLVGLGLMIRIYRADPEAGRSSWRATRN